MFGYGGILRQPEKTLRNTEKYYRNVLTGRAQPSILLINERDTNRKGGVKMIFQEQVFVGYDGEGTPIFETVEMELNSPEGFNEDGLCR